MSEIVQSEDFVRLGDTIDNAEEQWGTEFDNKNTLNDWGVYVGIYVSRATSMENRNDPETQYDALIKAAGLALTAAARVRQGKVRPRHYDPFPKTQLSSEDAGYHLVKQAD